MAAKDTFCIQTLITKTAANRHAVSSGGQTGFGAQARARHPSREEGLETKKNCLLCRPGLRQGWLCWAIFSRVFRLSQEAAKKGEAFSAGPTPLPPPQPLDDSTKLCATFGDRVFILATGNKHKIQRWRDVSPFPDVFVFSDFKVCSHYLHVLTGKNLIQESLVTIFCFFSN